MAQKLYIAGVCTAEALGKNSSGAYEHIFSAHALSDSGINFTSSMEEVRGGQGAKLYGRFNHTTGMTINLVDVLFDMKYIALQTGASVASNAGSVLDCIAYTAGMTDPGFKPMGASFGSNNYVAWIVPKDSSKEITLAADTTANGLLNKVTAAATDAGECVIRYFGEHSGTKLATIKANFNPAEMTLILTGTLFAGESMAASSSVGTITIKIPRFQLDGTIDLAMAMTSAANISLSGTALAQDEFGCESNGVYCEIVQYVKGNDWTTGLRDIAVDDDTAKVGSAAEVWGLYGDNTTGRINETVLTTAPTAPTAPYLVSAGVGATGAWASTGAKTVTAYKADNTVIATATVTVSA